MPDKKSGLIFFDSITVSEPKIENKTVKTLVTLDKQNKDQKSFEIFLKYEKPITKDYLPILRLAFTMPLLNYGLFTKKIKLDYPISTSDKKILNSLNQIFSRDIFVNKILKRRADYIKPDFHPDLKLVKPNDAEPEAVIEPNSVCDDQFIVKNVDKRSCGILSSGGKESLLTYGLLNEIGCKTYPYYINESGGHWRTALTAYRYHKKNDDKTKRVWTNIDRFYVFMLDNLDFIRSDHRKIWADTYPIRLCIFPFYVYSLLPLFASKKIGNLLIGSEFDDFRTPPKYLGIKHYYGIFDQHQDFDTLMNKWYEKRIPGLYQWSAVRNITGLVVERMLVKRYPELARVQRSCHSCHFENKEIIPCGVCSKCMGVLLYLHANKAEPSVMNFKNNDVESFLEKIDSKNLRLDEDEKNHSFYLINNKNFFSSFKPVNHVEKIHVGKNMCDLYSIPYHLRDDLIKIIKQYTTGFCILKDDSWSTFEEKS